MNGGQLQARVYYLDSSGSEQQVVITFTERPHRIMQHQGSLRASVNAYMALTGGTLLSLQLEVVRTLIYDTEQTQPIEKGKVIAFPRRSLDLEL